MCKGCQYCLESCYWHLIEKRFCYDENIALYEEPTKWEEKLPNAFENIAFYDQVAIIAGRSIVTIDTLPKKTISHQPKARLRWWEHNVDEQNKVNEAKNTDQVIVTIPDAAKPKEEVVETRTPITNFLQVNEVTLRKKSLAERRSSRSLTLTIDRNLEVPIIRQASMPKFYIETPDISQADPYSFNEPSKVLTSPLSVQDLSDPFDLRSVVQLERDNRSYNSHVAPVHKQSSIPFSRLSLIKEKLKTTKLKKQYSTSNLPHSIQHI